MTFSALLHESNIAGNARPTLSEVDEKIERWISEFTGLQNMEFDEETALNTLLKYELIRRDDEDENRFRIYPLDEAIARLYAGRFAKK